MKITAESLVVDPISGNVFFMNSESESISVMSYDGQAYKTLMTSESINASIKMVTQDSVNRYSCHLAVKEHWRKLLEF